MPRAPSKAVLGAGHSVGASVRSGHGGPVPWWRVVHADGSPPTCHDGEARQAYLAEGTALRASGRVDMDRAYWEPAPPETMAP